MKKRENRSNPIVRLGSAAVDLMVTVFLANLLGSIIVGPIVVALEPVEKCNTQYIEILSDLEFINKDTGAYIIYDEDQEFDITRCSEYDEILKDFYTIYDDEEGTLVNAYVDSQIEATDCFIVGNDNVIQPIGTSEKLEKFYYRSFENAVKFLLDNDAKFKELDTSLKSYQLIINSVSYIISFALLYLLLPKFMKEGQTLGKKMFNLKVSVNKDDGVEEPKYSKIIIRHLVLLCEVGISLLLTQLLTIFAPNIPSYLGYIPLVLCSLVLIIHPHRLGLHDLAAGTYVWDFQSVLMKEEQDKRKLENNEGNNEENKTPEDNVQENNEEENNKTPEEELKEEKSLDELGEDDNIPNEEPKEENKE